MESGQKNDSVDNASSEEFSVSVPKVELPKGGGAISGIGEKFAANPVTGTGSMSVPIATSPGRAGFGPQLSLSYNSGSGNSVFGFGWNLSIPAITRKTDKGLPRYLDADESDVFILSGAEDLVPQFNENLESADGLFDIQRYRPRVEGLFARIERWSHKIDGNVHWRSLSRDNILTIYGKNNRSRIADPDDPIRIFSWLICETRDDKGNAIIYDYKPDNGIGVDFSQVHERNRGKANDPRRSANRYLKRIRYGNVAPLFVDRRRPFEADDLIDNTEWMFEVVFDYGEHDAEFPMPNGNGQWDFRQDAFSTYRPGFEVRTTRLCQRVLMFHHFPGESGVGIDCLVRSTDFSYSHQRDKPGTDNSRNPAIYSFLEKVTQTGYKRRNGQLDSDYLKSSLPPVEFEYSQPIVQDRVEEIDSSSLENLPIGVDGAGYRWTDLHGEGIPGILSEQAGSWWYKRNISPISPEPVEFTPLEQIASQPNLALAAGAQFMDLEGNGQLDIVELDGPTPGRYQHDKQEGWQNFQPFTSRLNRSFQDPNLKFLDLDGDGHADLLISEDNAFIWHASLAEAGYGPARRVAQALDEEAGPRLVFEDDSQSLFLADMSGDGLTDLVRIRNGEICYWPNQGYCRFGTKISMGNAPHFDNPDQFEHSRLRLADIDGSGTTDAIYLHSDGVRLYFNQSGNSWSSAQTLTVQPRVDEMISIAPTDLLGNGTACLVWSSPLPSDRPHR
ncbi:MAG: toxin, partial [Gammaproteobacteria bacterium]|nr:toxin [Gammaproteobacteria bacterium]